MKKSILNIIYAMLFLATLLLQISCDDTSIADVEYPTENVSYSKHIQPLLNKKCATPDCHSSAAYAGGYSMQSWTEITTPPYIIKGEPKNSLAYLAATGQGGLPIMPPIEAAIYPFVDKEVTAFRTWIEEGAKNN